MCCYANNVIWKLKQTFFVAVEKTMSMSWAALKQEAINLAKDVGVSGREHHSLAKHGSPLLATIRVHGIPAEHREWVWPILLHSHVRQ